MSKININILAVVVFTFLVQCQKPVEAEDLVINDKENTLGSPSVGSGLDGLATDYFYNFEDQVEAKFFRYRPSILQYDYGSYFSFLRKDPPSMSYKTFSDYLVSMKPLTSDSAIYTRRYYIDSLSVENQIVNDSILISSSQFKNLESLEWDFEAEPSQQRYRLRNSEWVQSDTMIYYADTFDVSAYRAVVDTPYIDAGILFVDSSEWKDTNYVFMSSDQVRFIAGFQFIRQQLNSDSLVFRENTDCNDNGEWDVAEDIIQDYNSDGKYEILYEYDDQNNNGTYDNGTDTPISDYNGDGAYGVVYEFDDSGNGVWDVAEIWYDIDGDSIYDLNEPYQDRNCNQKWDDEETYTDANLNGIYDSGEEYVDRGNGIFDNSESFTLQDIDGDGVQEKMLFTLSDRPDNLLVDWSDPNNPVPKMEINLNDDLVDRWGNTYNNIIESVDFTDVKYKDVGNIDSLVTLFTRKKVGHILENNKEPEDYYITKSEWVSSNLGIEERKYNYHIFYESDHLNQVVYPSYFLPEGFYFTPNEIEDGFWQESQLKSEILYYTYNGLLRDGERVDTSYYDTTSVAVYFIEKSYSVNNAEVTVPASKNKYDDLGGSGFLCLRDSSTVLDESECPAVDTTFTDCFVVTRLVTMTMIGSGVEFGQRTKTWLAKGHGIVKSEVDVRWTEHPYNGDQTYNGVPDENNEAWIGLSRIELAEIKVGLQGSAFRRLTNPATEIKLKELAINPDFNFDPFILDNQIGINTIDLRELVE